jgi:hypothetical protein
MHNENYICNKNLFVRFGKKKLLKSDIKNGMEKVITIGVPSKEFLLLPNEKQSNKNANPVKLPT